MHRYYYKARGKNLLKENHSWEGWITSVDVRTAHADVLSLSRSWNMAVLNSISIYAADSETGQLPERATLTTIIPQKLLPEPHTHVRKEVKEDWKTKVKVSDTFNTYKI